MSVTKRKSISLKDPSNRKMFEDALKTCQTDKDYLRPAERSFVADLGEAYQLVGDDYEPTIKQFNWLRVIALDLCVGN